MAYPDWVMAHKPKGHYVNKVNDHTYRLYRGHSERVPGTKTVKRIVDEYIGTIYEDQGLVRSQPQVKGPIQVLRYGISCLLHQLFYRYTATLGLQHPQQQQTIFALGLLRYQYHEQASASYTQDWLSVRYPGLNLSERADVEAAVSRMQPMLADVMQRRFGDELPAVLQIAAGLYRVQVNGHWYLSELSQQFGELERQYGISWEV
jgi:hypothetical protein